MFSPASAVIADREKRSELCRICFSRRSTFLNIFETYVTESMTIAAMFIQFLGENMYPDDSLPEYICCDCIEEIMETENINDAFKVAVRHSVWRTRLHKQMESLGGRRNIIGRPSMMDLHNYLSGDNILTEKGELEECENSSILQPIYIEFGNTVHSNQSDKGDEEIEKGLIGKLNQVNCLESYVHECSICRGIFLNAEELINHKNLFHKVSKEFHCGKCHKKFKTVKGLERHVEKYSFTCKSKGGVKTVQKIKKSFIKSYIQSPSASIVTENEETSEEKLKGITKINVTFTCDKCNHSFGSCEALKAHLREIHKSKMYCICTLCNKGFLSRVDLEIHKYSHNKEYLCDVCKREFFTLEHYKRHLRICQGKAIAYKCQICGQESTTKGNLRLHISTHSLVKKFECKMCNKKYSRSSTLYRHIRAFHLKQKPYKCGICHKSFPCRSKLVVHLVSHSDERRFECSLCERNFKSKPVKRVHERKVHNFIKPLKVNLIVDEHVLAKMSCFN